MQFSRKMCLMVLKVTWTLPSLYKIQFWKKNRSRDQIGPPSLCSVNQPNQIK